ncbi:hypothetical protein PRUPE_2G068900 [Prunus persica]|uniref:TIR domain-containing protein n=1 Tax=Prunus persica TaxID=3760 RepID=A0A251QCF8_PRUPE|nr:hypothetical protein PRUPE_2G068900 [Prunus persica]
MGGVALMTTQPDSSSPSSPPPPPYDVFLSFSGADTRTTFTDHLRNALVGKGIHTFIDDDELPRGEQIKPALVKAIEDSRISVIVFSENYASSRWCFDELVEILRCKQSKQQIIWPIFYKVDPSHVRNQTSKFGDAFDGLIESKFKDDKEKVLIQSKWRKALTEAANLSGWHFKKGEYEATFINNIVDGIFSKVLSRTSWHVATYPVGIQSRVQDVERLLDVGGNGRRMVGIWGPSGIGKTTIAKAIWNAIAHKFEGSCFLENVREKSMPHGGLIQLQKTLLHKYLGKKLKIHSVAEGIGVIEERLGHKKILLILDDVDQLEQLKKLAGDDWFGEGSRVIITTQDSGLLKRHGIDLIYEVQKLYGNPALELFSLNAFGTNNPPEDYLGLAQSALEYAQGIPLALTLLGSHLRNEDKDRWRDILDSYEGQPYTGIRKILQKSYDALDNSVQQVFLDIACFFKGEKKDFVLQIVSNSKNKVSRDCIEVLIEKAMITIHYGMIRMHDLLEKLGKDIVHEECPNDPGKRSRLWSPEDVYHVLTVENNGTRKIKGIMLKFSKADEIRLHSKCFAGMINLEIFINRNVFLSGDVEYLPNELRLIDWGGYRCQLQFLPSEFHQVHLVDFNMPGGRIKRLGKLKNMPKLTSMNLRGCQFLEKIPDLSGSPNIKYLNLSHCTSLVEVDDSVGRLDKLVRLNLKGCVMLMRFATRLRLKSLENLDLRDCKRLESFPEIEVKMESLSSLDILGSGVRELPSSIAYLTGLRELDLRGCFNLTRIATLRLKSLEELDLRNCERLESFPKIEVEMESLWRLYMNGSGIRELPPSIAYLTGLQQLDLSGCFNLTRFATRLRLNSLESLSLRDCKRLESFLELENMPKLTTMNLRGCQFLKKIPDLSGIPNIKYLYLCDCTSLVEIDDSVGLLDKLIALYLNGCVNLTSFATRLRLNSLESLSLCDCKRLESFPEIEVKMESLLSLDISGSGVRELPSSIAYLTGLSHFRADYCENLKITSLQGLYGLQRLTLLSFYGCPKIFTFGDTVNSQVSSSNSKLQLLPNLSGLGLKGCNPSQSDFLLLLDCWYTLTELDLSGNNFVNLPICFSKFVNLESLDLSDCKSLLEIPEQVLPQRVEFVSLDNCTSLEKIPKLAWVLLEKIPEFSPEADMYLSLTNCVRLRGYDITENIFLNQASVSPYYFDINLPGDDIPKWFSCRKDATLVEDYLNSLGEESYTARCEVSFEFPPNLKWETLRLVLCVVSKARVDILVNEKLVSTEYLDEAEKSHVQLMCIPSLEHGALEEPLTWLEQGNTCQVIFCLFGRGPTPIKIPCGVHLLGHQVANVTVDRGQGQWLLRDTMAVDDDQGRTHSGRGAADKREEEDEQGAVFCFKGAGQNGVVLAQLLIFFLKQTGQNDVVLD